MKQGIQRQIVTWGKEKARREVERNVRYERSTIPTAYHRSSHILKDSLKKPIPTVHSTQEFIDLGETSDEGVFLPFLSVVSPSEHLEVPL